MMSTLVSVLCIRVIELQIEQFNNPPVQG
jgi:hypothetical protein